MKEVDKNQDGRQQLADFLVEQDWHHGRDTAARIEDYESEVISKLHF